MRATVYVLPVPGPPEITINLLRAAAATATFCQSSLSLSGKRGEEVMRKTSRKTGSRVAAPADELLAGGGIRLEGCVLGLERSHDRARCGLRFVRSSAPFGQPR